MKNSQTAVSKVFLSCDLTGSTAFKQRGDYSPNAPWQKALLQFYREFPQTLGQIQASQNADEGKTLEFILWKAVGDELIFTCDVKKESDIHWAIQIWLKTMTKYKDDSLSDAQLGVGSGPRLGVKGGAFIATFPGPDSQSSIPRRPDVEESGGDVVSLNAQAVSKSEAERNYSSYLYDYFGPSIDTGFRVFSKCSSRYFTLSMEIAYALLEVDSATNKKEIKIENIVLLSDEALKGVWGNRSYPLFALDLEYNSPVNQAWSDLQRNSFSSDHAAMRELCKVFYNEQDWPCRIYLPDSSQEGYFTTKPKDPLEHYNPETASVEEGDIPLDDVSPGDHQVPDIENAPTS